jgi:hypothetical protein
MLYHPSDFRSAAFKPLKTMIQEGRDPKITRDRLTPLETTPHYTDRAYDDPDNKFGSIERHHFLAPGYTIKHNGYCLAVSGASYEYSDRLQSWYSGTWRKAYNYALGVGNPPKSAAFYEDFLSALTGNNVELVHIIVGIDTRGWYYQVFGMINH